MSFLQSSDSGKSLGGEDLDLVLVLLLLELSLDFQETAPLGASSSEVLLYLGGPLVLQRLLL